MSISKICDQFSISKGTLYNYLRHQGVIIGKRP
ncbi:helix-turn-helix domain-containing protein [Phototrophicus methaneseepsis]|uniref:Helix-turn-helix domain-containing protein n=1 Tax=Phototrophicus methaneseepsis TaxID=2710758 RepID=A0A7S8E8S2_9CHLR|nr:helix-turn-helix domain-containing protein [Phototrophicus methaneseepsis]